MAVPGVLGFVGHAESGLEVLQHPQVVQRMHIAGDMHGQGSHLGPQGGVGGQQGRHGEDLFEVFEDGQGLGDTHFTTGMAGVHQQRQQALGVEVAIGRQVLLAAILDQVDRRLAVGQPLEIQGDADPVCSAGAPVAVEREFGIHGSGPIFCLRHLTLAAPAGQVAEPALARRQAVKPESFPYSRHGLATWRAMRLAAVRIS
ncbi:hypothetical protein D3C81_1658690 [compost metagenome]